ncbi:MutS domain III family protein [Tritrichomonas foetus]|uniref:MutS domain III family protein n=1 Tax=Tritrichomonas foetus TaxID=1144522 RepID=A0A1J4JU13_9EUKA|nr:MutS domain III family protein [Tritrichomonas foetus]|eukprot:OHT00741.1 MutS domain III family protein [Tritrichomonas foetus]
MQQSLFQFFNPKNSTKSKAPASPSKTTKKASAIKNLKKVVNEDEDFDISDLESESDDEKEFSKMVTKGKLMESNSPSETSESESEEIVSKPNRIKAPKSKKQTVISEPKASPKKSSSKKSSGFASPSSSSKISPSSSMESISRAISSDESELPDWLTKNLRDAQKRPPTDPNYDPTTVYIPPSAENSFTPFQKQFWEIKRVNFDAVVMIRKGKFYEMFSTDAIFTRDKLKLRLTNRGKEPMCGVPEKAFSEWALKIINAGKRVCKVEQMETAVDQRNRKGGEKAIKRELVQIYSLGTIDDFEMLESSQPSYLMSLRSSDRSSAGVCLVDCSTGSFHLGVVNEDDLMDVLIRFEPVEVVFSRDTLCPEHLEVVKQICGGCATHAKSGTEWWDPQLSMNAIQRTAGWDNIPEFLANAPKGAIAALGGCVAYLSDHKIAKSLLSLQRFSSLDEAGGNRFLTLDSSALTNLQIIGRDEHCLLHIIDRCSTSFGRRRLRFWLMHPLRNISAIEARLDAVEELFDSAYVALPKKMQSIPDLERILSRVYSNRCSVKVFLDCINSLKKAVEFLQPLEAQVKSALLKSIVPHGKSSILLSHLDGILKSLEIHKSLEQNEFVVKKGIYDDIDEIEQEVANAENELDEELDNIREELKCPDIKFFHQQSEKYQVQIPNKACKHLDDSYSFVSQNKDVKRYRTPRIKELIMHLEDVENERQKKRSGCQKRFIDDFTKKSNDWDQIVESLAELDCLLSLSSCSQRWGAHKCRPKFITKDSPEANGHAYISIKQMIHPCVPGRCIPNDIHMSDKYVLIITGPNASGKSTFARMCCVSIVLAQLGCYLPALEATMTVYDQIFTRIGAGDRLFSGQSTFAVELAETARLMKNATADSFVVLDELGRGTSTFDGIAIASAVLEYFIKEKQCPLVFCTHYHVITQQFQGFGPVRNASMKYIIGDQLTLLHELIDGPCSSSFGCAVARMCGLDKSLTEEAQKIADDFEARHKALHVNSNECEITKIELKPEFKKAYEDVRDIMAGSEGNAVKVAKLEEIINNQVKKLDLG